MKTAGTAFFLSCLSAIIALRTNAQILVDNFGGNSINPALWTVYNTPTGNSSVTEGGGDATFINGAGLLTANGFPNASISGNFEFTGDNDDRFSIYLRSDGTTFDPYWQDLLSGIQVQFSPSSNPSGIGSLWIANASTDPYAVLAQANPTINMDTYYNFSITDSGSQISVYFNNSTAPILTVDTTLNDGDTIGIFNREQLDVGGPQHEVEIDYVSITSVPEPKALPLLGLSMFGMYLRRRKHAPAARQF